MVYCVAGAPKRLGGWALAASLKHSARAYVSPSEQESGAGLQRHLRVPEVMQ